MKLSFCYARSRIPELVPPGGKLEIIIGPIRRPRVVNLAIPVSVGDGLRRGRIYFVEQLEHVTEKELLTIHGVGKRGVELIKSALAQRGMSLSERSQGVGYYYDYDDKEGPEKRWVPRDDQCPITPNNMILIYDYSVEADRDSEFEASQRFYEIYNDSMAGFYPPR